MLILRKKPTAAGSSRGLRAASGRRSLPTLASAFFVALTLAPSGFAAPVLRGIEAASTSSSSTSLTIPTPSGVEAGDVLVAGLTVRIPDFAPITSPDGWTLIRRESNDPAYASLSQALYLRVADGTEATSYTWGWLFALPVGAAGGIAAYSGVDPVDPVDSHSGAYGSWSTSITAPAVGTSRAEAAVIAFFGYNGAKTTTAPDETVERYDISSTGSSYAATSAAADRVAVDAGVVGPLTAHTAIASSSTIGQLVALRPLAAPINTSRPTVSGTAREGEVLGATPGLWSSAEPPTYTYQWRRCDALGTSCDDITGATTDSYRPSRADVGAALRVVVVAGNSAGSTSAVSDPTAPVTPAVDVFGRLYAALSPFNQPVPPEAPVDPNSPTMVQGLVQAATNAGAIVAVKRYSTPIYYADASTPRYDVRLTASWRAADYLLDVPIPSNATPAGGDDKHMVVIDTTNGCEYDFYDADPVAGGWEADWANALPLGSLGIFEKGLSARGSGFALPAGIIRPHELRNPDGSPGRIEHALVFNTPYVKAGGPVSPATESDGQSTSAYAIPEGAHLQLDPDFDVGTLDKPYERVIARALQEFGAYVGDVSGSSIDFYAEDPKGYASNPYAAIWGDQTYVRLPTKLIENLRVLELPPQFSPSYRIVPNGCNRFG
jgi:hypothetical protein